MNTFLILSLFLLDLFLANLFNNFLFQTLLVAALLHITRNDNPSNLGLICIGLGLESFIELGELFLAPLIPLLILSIFLEIKRHFNYPAISATILLLIYLASKMVFSLIYGLKANQSLTICQFYTNLTLLIIVSLLYNLFKYKGRLSSRFYRW